MVKYSRKRAQAKRKTGKKLASYRKAYSTWRGRRVKRAELVSRVYSQRWETRLAQHAVAYMPYATEQPISLESTAIYAMGYDPKKGILYITFWTYKMRGPGNTYAYYGVPRGRWDALNEASSKGRYFYYNIRGAYNYRRL